MLHRCDKCGAKLAGDSKFCPQCGRPVVAISLPEDAEISETQRKLRGDWNDSERKKVEGVVGNILLLAFSIAVGFITTAVLVARGNTIPEYVAISNGWIVNTWGMFIVITLFVTVCVFGVVAAIKYLTR